jgi:hypothetical protein
MAMRKRTPQSGAGAQRARTLPVAFLAPLLLLGSFSVHAHVSSDSFLVLQSAGSAMTGHWDIALRDLDVALNLDVDNDRRLRWGEVRSRQAEIARYALARLSLQSSGSPCELHTGALQIDHHQGEAFAVVPLAVECATVIAGLAVRYQLFESLDAGHRGLLSLQIAGESYSAALEPSAIQHRFAPESATAWRGLMQYVTTGIEHIWSGYDHLLFLLSLLLPAVLRRQRQTWESHLTLAPAVIDIAKVVSAFTAAHSITLALATFDILRIPARVSESAIALSIVVAALSNLRPTIMSRRWMVAFAFGLLHGFGFANVLSDLNLPAGNLGVALFGFNLGVEAGQLAIVAVFLPLAFALRHTIVYRRVVLLGGSVAVAMLGAVWFVERALNLQLIG